ncbi:hypothetical protein [Nautilia sp.]
MPIKFESQKDNYKIELDFEQLDIDNVFIHNMTKYMQVKANKIFFLNENRKALGTIEFESEEKAVNFFNFTVYMIGYKVIFKDKFAVKNG